jgi:RNA polymerase sigma factor (sigma-70 family)
MSPLAVRRYRAERLLQAEFSQLQARVVGIVARRVGAAGGGLDEADLEAAYALAWQGLYARVLAGEEVENPIGWLILATHRRAIDEQRSRRRAERGIDQPPPPEPDLAARLDDRDRLRELFEGLRSQLGRQERQAAVLCYVHGLTRSEAASRMGISERRMKRLMEGRGPGRPGLAEKLGALAASIVEGRWCEQQGSLMRGLAFGILDRDGERYRLALAHSANCSACRAYVASLRGLAVVLPPVVLPGTLTAAILARAGERAGAAAVHSGAAGGTAGSGLLGGSGAAGASGAGSGWILAGSPLGAKLAAGCVLALGVGAGCVGLGGEVLRPHNLSGHAHRRTAVLARRLTTPALNTQSPPVASPGSSAQLSADSSSTAERAAGSGRARAAREFGPEQALSGGSVTPAATSGSADRASAASLGSPAGRSSSSSSRNAEAAREPQAIPSAASQSGAAAEPTQAAREFSPG